MEVVEDALSFLVLTVFPETYSPGLKPGSSDPSFILEKPKLDAESHTTASQTPTLVNPSKLTRYSPCTDSTVQRNVPECAVVFQLRRFATAQCLFGSGCWHRSEPHPEPFSQLNGIISQVPVPRMLLALFTFLVQLEL